jgi:molybdopterin/thiamine biosynthesis adenylyltransferase
MSYQTWFERRPELLNQEIESFKENDLNFTLDLQARDENRSIQFNGKVIVNEEKIELELIYPSEFPAQPIIVRANEKKLYRHQNPFEKNLCIIPHNQDGWDSSMTGAYLVKQAILLLEDIEKGEAAVAANEVDSPEPWSNYIIFENAPLLITEDLPDSIQDVGSFTISRYAGQVFWDDNQGVFRNDHFVLEKLNQLGESIPLEETLPFQRREMMVGNKINGNWFHLVTPPNFNLYDPKTLTEELEKHLGNRKEIFQLKSQLTQFRINIAKSKKGKEVLPPHFALIFDEENYERNKYRKAFIWGVYDFKSNSFRYSKPQYITKEEHFRRIPDLASLDSKKVLIAGLGSLGSAVAVELGKCGVGSFVLIDKDAFEVGNVVRHIGTFEFVGMAKTKVVEEQILSHYPFSQIEKLNYNIGTDVEIMEQVYNKVSDVDLVINLTAEQSVIKIFNRLSLELNVPVIHGWISNGAWGGRILRTIPGQTGCYLCQEENEAIEVSSAPVNEIYPRGCGFPTFTGASFDIYEVAAQTVRIAVNTLLNNKVEYDHIIIQNYPYPKVEVFPHKKDSQCPLCGDKSI